MGPDGRDQAMRDWFENNYRPFVFDTPYEGKEEGFQTYVHDPEDLCDPLDILRDEFCEVVPAVEVDSLANKLTDESTQWVKR